MKRRTMFGLAAGAAVAPLAASAAPMVEMHANDVMPFPPLAPGPLIYPSNLPGLHRGWAFENYQNGLGAHPDVVARIRMEEDLRRAVNRIYNAEDHDHA